MSTSDNAQIRETPLRAISVRQPWAWAITFGGKTVENRSRRDPWKTAIGERILVHASKSHDSYDDREVMRLAGTDALPVMPHGALVAQAVVLDVHHANQCRNPYSGRYCSKWAQPDQWHIVLDDVEPLPSSVPCRGALGLFTPEIGAML